MEDFVKINKDGHKYEISKYLYHNPTTLLPITDISWIDAIEICLRITEERKDGYLYRLPTEEEWEYAATGGDGRIYPWGNEFDTEKCNVYESRIKKVTPVDSYPNGISPFGIFDMAGNAWEWCMDRYDMDKDTKVIRGGSWDITHLNARCASRLLLELDGRDFYTSFRAIRTWIGREEGPLYRSHASPGDHQTCREYT